MLHQPLLAAVASYLAMSTSPSSNLPLFRVKSAWSKAGVGTSIVLQPQDTEGADCRPSTRVVFDIGSTPTIADAFPASTVIVSHGHVDHVGGMFSHARAHSVAYGGSTPTYYVPKPLVSKLEEARSAFSAMDALCVDESEDNARSHSLLQMNIVGVEPGDEIELSIKKLPDGKRLFLRVFDVAHCGHPGLGYCIVSRRNAGLKPEYRDLSGNKIRDLVKSGVEVKGEPVETVEVMYSGDTSIDGIMKRDIEEMADSEDSPHRKDLFLNEAFKAPLILCEATYLEEGMQEQAKSRGHMSIEDIPSVLSSHGWNAEMGDDAARKIVLLHLSARHKPANRALELIQKNLPVSVAEYCDVAISSLMTEAEMRKFQGQGLLQPSGLVSLGDIKKGSSKRAKKDSSKSKPFAPNVGAIEKGVVTRLEPYGAFVQLQAFRGRGLVHQSQLGGPLGVNDEVFVKVIDVTMERDDRSGNIHQKISLSTRNINQESGTDMAKTALRS